MLFSTMSAELDKKEKPFWKPIFKKISTSLPIPKYAKNFSETTPSFKKIVSQQKNNRVKEFEVDIDKKQQERVKNNNDFLKIHI